ncbi:MAG TPA: acetolactate decarboxylase [bacterium]|nr:acetolactate decarboxylase [bacterium]
MRHYKPLLFIFFLLISTFSFAADRKQDTLFQVSTINALFDGVFEGEISFSELRKHGNFGMGTVSGLDGEMVALDGRFYKIGYDGKAVIIPGSVLAPFAMVTFFSPDRKAVLGKTDSFKHLEQQIDAMLPSGNIFHAIKIDGTFRYIKTRSVEKQKPPYPKLADVIAKQSVFEFSDVKGTIVGFRCPSYIGGTNLAGYHFHFITADRKSGGHLLECSMEGVSAQIDYTENFYLVLPKNSSFLNMP